MHAPIYSQIEDQYQPTRTKSRRLGKEDRTIEPGTHTWKNQDGEFELVLGNKQLLSVFFFVVVLLAVFFVMGYMVGRSTGGDLAKRNTTEPVQRTDTTTAMPKAGSPDAKPLEVPQVTKSDTPQETAPATSATTEPAPTATTPAATPPAAAAPPTAQSKEGSKPLEVPPVNTSVSQPVAGTYVQVSAPMRAEGELIVEMLSKKGFHALLAPGPDERRVRVLVGPTKDAADTGRAITDLEKLGFKGAFPRKY